jgi:hypothetical protein
MHEVISIIEHSGVAAKERAGPTARSSLRSGSRQECRWPAVVSLGRDERECEDGPPQRSDRRTKAHRSKPAGPRAGCCSPAEPARRASLPTRRDAQARPSVARLRRRTIRPADRRTLAGEWFLTRSSDALRQGPLRRRVSSLRCGPLRRRATVRSSASAGA